MVVTNVEGALMPVTRSVWIFRQSGGGQLLAAARKVLLGRPNADGTAPPLPLIATQLNRRPQPIMVRGSRNDKVATTSRRSNTVVDLTLQHTNHAVLVEEPAISIRPVGTRRRVAGSSR